MFLENIIYPFLEAIEKYSFNNAFCINENFYSYSDFSIHISKIREKIRLFEKNGSNFGLVVNDDIETYASIFAIWLEGKAYVPLHPQQPLDRNMEIINQADIIAVIDSSERSVYNSIIVVKTHNLPNSKINLMPNKVADEALAYILFTSGSTGKPKGVQITRKNLGAFMKSFWEIGFLIDYNDKCLQCFDLTFDVSVQSYLVPLTRGACTYTIPHDQIKYSYVAGLFENHNLTFGAMSPSMIRYLRPYFDELRVPSIRYSILTAEASPVDLVSEWAECIPNAEIFDLYGPTEATIYCTYYKFIRTGPNKQLNGMLSIGKPMNGLTGVIIDEENNILGNNHKGEYCVSGDQITPGYWKNGDKNLASFIELNDGKSIRRYYKTGDLCYIDDDGDLMLSGRLDHQVKVQGYRIELGEIEYYARDFLQGYNAVALCYNQINGINEIALIIEGGNQNISLLIEHFKQKIPIYMIPSKIVFVDKFPINASGKVDRIELRNFI